MTRDMELIRAIMLNVEKGDIYGGVEGYDDDPVNYHKALLVEKGLIEGKPHYTSAGQKPSDIPDRVRPPLPAGKRRAAHSVPFHLHLRRGLVRQGGANATA